MADKKVIVLNNDNFKSEVLDSDIPVLVDFWASWCGPCKMIGPIIDQLAVDYDGKAKIAKVNVDDQRELATKYKVMSIPTLFMFKNGEIIDQITGARPKAELEKIIEKAL